MSTLSTNRRTIPPMRELDEMARQDFMRALAPLFEGAPWFLARLAADRPFGTYDQLLDRASAVALAMPGPEQAALIDSHPRIGAPPGSLSALSSVEQGHHLGLAADPEAGDENLAAELERSNAAYEARFGFRFVIFVAGRPRSQMASIIEERLTAQREAEKRRALIDVVSIARDRLRRIGATDGWAARPEDGT